MRLIFLIILNLFIVNQIVLKGQDSRGHLNITDTSGGGVLTPGECFTTSEPTTLEFTVLSSNPFSPFCPKKPTLLLSNSTMDEIYGSYGISSSEWYPTTVENDEGEEFDIYAATFDLLCYFPFECFYESSANNDLNEIRIFPNPSKKGQDIFLSNELEKSINVKIYNSSYCEITNFNSSANNVNISSYLNDQQGLLYLKITLEDIVKIMRVLLIND